MPRVYLPPQLIEAGLQGELMELDPDTSRKLTRVLRLTAGEAFVAFDGLGGEWDCALVDGDDGDEESRSHRSGKKVAHAAIVAERAAAGLGQLRISVAQALPRGEKMELV